MVSNVLDSLLAFGLLKPNQVVLLDEKVGDFKARTEEGLNRMRTGAVSGEKLVVKIGH